ncbi:4-hydroxybenzoate polyprenyltransferase/phosphoserine phosphatase [Rhodovulum iodosum]|uniref:4-hydroxybenzoate polyprenyltransferase/phosphoserine phosphatase n=1 Tax=Rhodovulum iodosum TaxID=68291 RepID=A0ABV3XZ96_9RHOB|nr:UbiA family prenyltransferase [Rhodovulum robiginosum]RSK36760.1 UbiA family prenyltransferase [Rhodovulum robiginosum]
MSACKPLVLDVDGTFLSTDLLFETFWGGLHRAPLATLGAVARNIHDRAALKRALAEIAPPRFDLLPLNPELAARVEAARAEGREVVLASASDGQLVERLAAAHGLSAQSFASDGQTNLKGAAKGAALVAAYGERGFDYAGDNVADRAVWERADRALIVGAHPQIASGLRAAGHPVEQISTGWHWRDLARALRPHQWVKNVLLFVPMLAAHDFGVATVLLVLAGMVAFSAAASCIYIVNDLLDLEADRLHPTKCRRPFAAGTVPIKVGMAASLGLALVALGIAAALGAAMLGVVALYMTLSLAYSLRLKRMRWVDIATLAALYTLRVVAGAVASKVDVSVFMLVFVYPVFLTLGAVKRLTELALATTDERLPGRGYGRPDREDLLNVAGLGIVGALLTFFGYSFTEQAHILYPTRWLLWVALVPLAIWLIRMVVLGWQGKQDYDPIVFALRDKLGIGLICFALSLMFYGAGLWQRWFGF